MSQQNNSNNLSHGKLNQDSKNRKKVEEEEDQDKKVDDSKRVELAKDSVKRYRKKFELEVNDVYLNKNQDFMTEEEVEKYKKRIGRGDSIGMSDDPQLLMFLGTGYPLFFDFIKFCCYLLTIMILTTGGFNLASNIMLGEYCYPQKDGEIGDCAEDWQTIASLANKKGQSDLTDLQELLNFLSVFVCIGLFQVFRYKFRMTSDYCDDQNITEVDYTCFITHWDQVTGQQDEPKAIKKAIEDFFENDLAKQSQKKSFSYEVYCIHLLMNLDQLEKFRLEKYEAEMAHFEDIDNKELREDFVKKLEQFVKLQKFLQGEDGNSIELNGEKKYFADFFSGRALICFEQEKFKYWAIKTGSVKFKDVKIEIQEAPEPGNIYWENQCYTDGDRTKRGIIAEIIYYIYLAFSFTCIAWLYSIQYEYQADLNALLDDPSSSEEDIESLESTCEYFTYFVAAMIQVLNGILGVVIGITSEYVHYPTHTLRIKFKSNKLSMGKFFNTALLTFVIAIPIPLIAGSDTLDEEIAANIWGETGLVFNQSSIIILAVFTQLGMSICDPDYIVQKATWWYKVDKKINAQQKVLLTQMEMNDLANMPTEFIEFKYSYIMYMMLMCAFYAPLIPLALVFTLIGMVGAYWSYKFSALYLRSYKYELSGAVANDMLEMLELFVPLYCIANAVYELFVIEDDWSECNISTFAILGIIFGILNAVLPMDDINKKLFQIEEDNTTLSYSEAIQGEEIAVRYNQMNPCEKGFHKLSNRLKNEQSKR